MTVVFLWNWKRSSLEISGVVKVVNHVVWSGNQEHFSAKEIQVVAVEEEERKKFAIVNMVRSSAAFQFVEL